MAKRRRRRKQKFNFRRNSGRNWDDPTYKAWRKKVYRRDKYTCQWPGCTCKKRLSAHHIQKWSEAPSLRFIVDNGITLCYKHHKFIKDKETYYVGLFKRIVARKNKK